MAAGLLEATGVGRKIALLAGKKKNSEGPGEGEARIEAGGSRLPWVLACADLGASRGHQPEGGHGRGHRWPPRLGEKPWLITEAGAKGAATSEGRREATCVLFFFSRSLSAMGGKQTGGRAGGYWGCGRLFYLVLEL